MKHTFCSFFVALFVALSVAVVVALSACTFYLNFGQFTHDVSSVSMVPDLIYQNTSKELLGHFRIYRKSAATAQTG